ncbi:hypothetical protein SNEBB_005987 [Seison nebaliae]|nr:hypothetical protein SNEBB_005987 [Seison nebaliae]
MSTTNMKRSSSKWDDDISVDHEKRLRLKLIEKTKRRKKDKKNNSDSPYTSPSLGDVDTDDNDSEVNETMSTIYYNPALSGCRSISNYRRLNRIEEGAFGIVFRAQDIASEKIYAIKKLKLDREREGFPITSLREINTILKAQHKNVVTVREIVVGENLNEIFIVMNYVEHDLKTLMTYSMKKPFTVAQVKCLLQQLLNGVRHLHENWIIHRDLKPSNLLLSHSGILKIGDFGLAREYASPLKQYTPLVVTLWYRAPELLLQSRDYYSTAVDLWSVGCIFGELLTMKPLFPGKTETDQIMKIFNSSFDHSPPLLDNGT